MDALEAQQIGLLALTDSAVAPVRAYPAPRAHPLAPPPEYGWLREHEPVARVRLADGRDAWLVTRNDYARLVYTDARFSSDRRQPGFPIRVSAAAAYQNAPPLMVGLDGQAHAEARRAVLSEFTNSRIKALRPHIQEVVDHFIDEMLAGHRPADLVAELAKPVPAMVICQQLGVPFADRAFFLRLIARLTSPSASENERGAATAELMSYLDDLVAAKEQDRTDDLISRQITSQREQGAVDRRALASLAYLLLVSGYETTASMIPLGVLGLLRNPEQLAIVRSDPAIMPQAVDELLRYFTPVEHITCRVAVADVEIGSVVVRAGDGVIVCGPAANRDGAVYANADQLDFRRPERHHLAFGYGPHQCIGQNLARAEIQIVYDTLFRRIRELRLAVEFDQLRFKLDSNFYGLHEMPVTW